MPLADNLSCFSPPDLFLKHFRSMPLLGFCWEIFTAIIVCSSRDLYHLILNLHLSLQQALSTVTACVPASLTPSVTPLATTTTMHASWAVLSKYVHEFY